MKINFLKLWYFFQEKLKNITFLKKFIEITKNNFITKIKIRNFYKKLQTLP